MALTHKRESGSHPALTLLGLALGLASSQGQAADTDLDLANSLSNPVAAMISVPLQFNYDAKIGSQRDGSRTQLNLQPVVPFTVNENWNLISRTIVPLVSQTDISPGSGRQTGLGDISQSLFFSPRQLSDDGVIWGAGPVFLLPTGSEPELSARKWGAGPSAVILRQSNGWTYGILANHVWSVAGSQNRDGISATFVQPFLSFTTPDAWTYAINTESTYDWKHSQWSVPVNVNASKLLKLAGMPVSIGGGLHYWVQSPDSAPHGWGVRTTITLLFPN